MSEPTPEPTPEPEPEPTPEPEPEPEPEPADDEPAARVGTKPIDPAAIAAARARDEAAAQADDEPEPEPAAEPDDEGSEANAAIAAAHGLYLATVLEVLGADAEVLPCSACQGFGFVEAELPPSTTQEQCPDCRGFGSVRTGSLVATQAELPCDTCRGNGWVAKVKPLELPHLEHAAAPPAEPPPPPVQPLVVPNFAGSNQL